MKNKSALRLEITEFGFKLGSEDFYLASGDIHYFRIHPSDWKQRLLFAKDFGLTAIQTYVPWHLCEPEPGTFDFYGGVGELDLKAYLSLADEVGLKVLLRPAPYICSECDMGGLPSWLMRNKDIGLRCCDEEYLAAVRNYYKRLCKEFVPFLSTNGGPVIAVAIDNEYGGYANDTEYLAELKHILEENGVDVPFYTTDGCSSMMLINGSLEGCMKGINFRSTPKETEKAITLLKDHFPDNPPFIGEFWAGRSIMWGEKYAPRNPQETADAYKIALNKGAYVNFYMFAGGTNFGFTSGSVRGSSFSPNPNRKYPRHLNYTTSYDCDALIGEDGNPTEKYFLCRDVLDEYLGKPKREHLSERRSVQSIEIDLTYGASLFDNIDKLAAKTEKSLMPMTMEQLGQNFGYVYYSTELHGNNSVACLNLENSVRDRATVYFGGKFVGTYMLDGENQKITLTVPREKTELGLLVENMGRYINSSVYCDHKGMISPMVLENTKKSFYWTQKSLPLNNLAELEYKKIEDAEVCEKMPVFLKGFFDAKAGIDTYLLTDGFTHGYVWINGFNIGRYWDIGPQKTLYIPGALLREKDNVIEIFDTQYRGTKKIKCITEHHLI